MTEWNGMPIIITTRFQQRRKHRKKRINKKWKKKYGVIKYDPIPEGEVLIYEGTVYMSERDFYLIKKGFDCADAELRGDSNDN